MRRTIHAVERVVSSSGVRIVGQVRCEDGTSFELFFAFPPNTLLAATADPFVAAMLVPSMAAGDTLAVESPISAELERGLSRVQDVFLRWHPEWTRVDVRLPPKSRKPAGVASGIAAFFSGGIDSLYTAIKHRAELTHLIYMRGIETTSQEGIETESGLQRVRRMCAALNIEILEGSTNIRTHFPLTWGIYHGAGLAATALALEPFFRRVYVPSTFAYDELVPWGSSPLLDEAYSTEGTQIVHDGAEVTRAEKVSQLLSQEPSVLDDIRVCVMNRGGSGNCGKCFKCVRTMVALAALGGLDSSGAFPDTLKGNRRIWWRAMRGDGIPYNQANLALLDRTGREPKIRALLAGVLRWQHRRAAWRTLFENSPLRHTLPALRFGIIKEFRRSIKNRG